MKYSTQHDSFIHKLLPPVTTKRPHPERYEAGTGSGTRHDGRATRRRKVVFSRRGGRGTHSLKNEDRVRKGVLIGDGFFSLDAGAENGYVRGQRKTGTNMDGGRHPQAESGEGVTTPPAGGKRAVVVGVVWTGSNP